MVIAEILYSVTGFALIVHECPDLMKSVITTIWGLEIALGNLIIVVVEASVNLEHQSMHYIIYIIMMYVGVFIFCLIAWKYEYVNQLEGYNTIHFSQ